MPPLSILQYVHQIPTPSTISPPPFSHTHTHTTIFASSADNDLDFLTSIQPSATKRPSGSIDYHDHGLGGLGLGGGGERLRLGSRDSRDAYKDFDVVFDNVLLVPRQVEAQAQELEQPGTFAAAFETAAEAGTSHSSSKGFAKDSFFGGGDHSNLSAEAVLFLQSLPDLTYMLQ